MATIYEKLFGPIEPHWGIDLLVIIIGIIALILNCLLLLITGRRYQPPWSIDGTIIIVIASSDTLASIIMIMGIILRYSWGIELLEARLFCNFGSALFCVGTVASLVFTSLLALIRYLVFVRQFKLSNQVWNLLALSLILIIISLFLWRASVSLFVLVPSSLYCTPQFWGTSWEIQFFGIISLGLLVPSLLIIPICYTLVTLHYRRLIIPTIIQATAIHRQFNTTLLQMSLIVIGYPLVTLPEFIMAFVNRIPSIQRNAIPDGLVIAALFSVTILNALFTLVLHKETRVECFRYLKFYASLLPFNILDTPHNHTSQNNLS